MLPLKQHKPPKKQKGVIFRTDPILYHFWGLGPQKSSAGWVSISSIPHGPMEKWPRVCLKIPKKILILHHVPR